MYELVAIAAVPGAVSKDFVRSLEGHYQGIMDATYIYEKPSKSKSLKPAVDWQTASQIMLDAMKTKKRLECGN